MAENSHISWTDHTFNPWIGCTNVGPGCDHCYAENLATKRLGVEWGPGKPRRRTRPANWDKVLTWHRQADAFKAERGRYPFVFAASLADIFDNEVEDGWRADFFRLVKETPKLQWLIVTKRIGNVAKMVPADWGTGYPNVTLLITVVNQAEADRDIPKLVAMPAARRGLSIEPMLGPIDLSDWLAVDRITLQGRPHWTERTGEVAKLDWVITGGESKQLPGARPLVEIKAEWIREIARQCAAADVPHHFKQWGHSIPVDQTASDYPAAIPVKDHFGKPGAWRVVWKDGMGRALDGIEHNGFPRAA